VFTDTDEMWSPGALSTAGPVEIVGPIELAARPMPAFSTCIRTWSRRGYGPRRRLSPSAVSPRLQTASRIYLYFISPRLRTASADCVWCADWAFNTGLCFPSARSEPASIRVHAYPSPCLSESMLIRVHVCHLGDKPTVHSHVTAAGYPSQATG
jgi:hypothetical protein